MDSASDVVHVDVDPDNPITEIESLCVNCHQQGVTRMMPTKIPYFKEIIVISFVCPHCGYKNTEVENSADLSDKGVKFTLKVNGFRDLSRQIIKSNFAVMQIPFCGFEIPTTAQKGKLSTLEGYISLAKESFQGSMDCGYYKEMSQEFNDKIKHLIKQLESCLNGSAFPYEVILDDPSGNSFIENPYAPQTDPGIKLEYYDRTREQTEAMGYSVENQILENKDSQNKPKLFVDPLYYDKVKDFTVYKSNSELSQKILDFTKAVDQDADIEAIEGLYSIPVDCAKCNTPGRMNTCQCEIPYFKEIIIMCFKCAACGYKSTEVKGGGGIAPKGIKLTLIVDAVDDLNRDLFKSEFSSIAIPELGFQSAPGSVGSMFTTVEGLLDKVIANVEDNPFIQGDSVEDKNKFDMFIERLKGLKSVKEKFTLIIDDPLSNSFIFSPGDPDNDRKLIKKEYERSQEQNDDLGISKMNVDC